MLEAALVLTLPLFSTATLFVGLLAFGALLFMRSRQDPHAPHRSFLLQYAFGFFFFAFAGLPAVLINLHLSGSFNFIKLFYSISLGAILLTSLFFYFPYALFRRTRASAYAYRSVFGLSCSSQGSLFFKRIPTFFHLWFPWPGH